MAENNQTSGSAIQKALEAKVLGDSGMITSGDTGIDKVISGLEESRVEGLEASQTRIGLRAGREKEFATEQFAQQKTTARESQRGFAVNTAALAQLDERTEKSLRDLDQREQELLSQATETSTQQAFQIAGLKFEALQFRQQAEQQAFTNLFNMGQLQLQDRAEDRLNKQFNQTFNLQKKQFEFTQEGKKADIATQFGVNIIEGESLADLIDRVQPIASAEQKARLSALKKDDEEQATNVQTEGLLRDAMLGIGLFAETGELSPESAALSVASVLRQQGFKVNAAKFNEITALAIRLDQEKRDTASKILAEEEGKGALKSLARGFNSFVSGLGEQAGRQGIPTPTRPQFSTIGDFSNIEDDPLTSFVNNLFGPSQ